jgi:YVTN family beta-propeller protein
MRRAPVAILVSFMLLAAACGGQERASVKPSPLTTTAGPSSSPSTTPGAPDSVYAHIGIGDMNPAIAGARPLVYVPNSMSNTVDVIDPTTLRIVEHFDVGRLPQHVTPSWDMRTLYVDNDMGNTLTPIDSLTGRRGTSFPVTDPYNLYFTPDGRYAIVVAERLQLLYFRDPHTWHVIKTVRIDHRGPNHLDFSADGRYLLISCEFSGYVVKVDLQTLEPVDSVYVGGKPADVRIAPDGKHFFVANEFRNGVNVIDPVAMKATRFIKTGHGAHGFVVSRDGKDLYVTNRTGGSVSVLDMAEQKTVTKWITGGSPDMGGVTADGKQLWVSNRYGGSVMAIDTTDGHVIARIEVGSGPHGVCVFPQPGRYSLGHTGNYR